jgi:RNA polymerase sigma factor (sigma-70 family)
MATNLNPVLIDIIRRFAILGEGRTDGQLLVAFLRDRDKLALEILVRRHAPMVWGVCRRTLARHHDAENAFQATFVVLLRKAASIRSPELLASWLYRVAQQTARKARQMAAKRGVREQQLEVLPEPPAEPLDDEFGPELRERLDDELSRLPDKYRVAIVLCDLQGKSRPDVAKLLRLPEGTVASRLARGRALLARRLARPGQAVSATSLAAVLPQLAPSWAVPAAVLTNTVKFVTLLAAGQAPTGLISAEVSQLTGGVLLAMAVQKLKAAGALLFMATLLLAGGVAAYHALTGQRTNEEANRKKAQDADLREYGSAAGAMDAARRYFLELWANYAVGMGPMARWQQWRLPRNFEATLDRATHQWTVTGEVRIDRQDGLGPGLWAKEVQFVFRYNPSHGSYKRVSNTMDHNPGAGWRQPRKDELGKWIQGDFLKPTPNPAPVSSLRLVGSNADLGMGEGRSITYTGDELTVRPHSRGVKVVVTDRGVKALIKVWILEFACPIGGSFEVGEYSGVVNPLDGNGVIRDRLGSPSLLIDLDVGLPPAKPSLAHPPDQLRHHGELGCSEFVVWEFEVKEQLVVRLAIDFAYGIDSRFHMDRGPHDRALRGSLRYNSRFQPAMPGPDAAQEAKPSQPGAEHSVWLWIGGAGCVVILMGVSYVLVRRRKLK